MAVETEFKFKIFELPKNLDFEKYEIIQTYFDGKRLESTLEKIFPLVDLKSINTFRIRKITHNNIITNVVTLKTKGVISRNEYEKEIDDESIINELTHTYQLSQIIKNRYKVFHKNFVFEFDEYLNTKTKLYTCEVELDDLMNIQENYNLITSYLTNDFHVDYLDVTNDYRYKNSNLLKYF